MMKNKLTYILFAAIVAASCTKDADPDVTLKEAKHQNVSYGTDVRHTMDVYLPEGRDEQTPLLVMVHGGSWIGGDKSDMTFVQDRLLASRLASVNINYRFASDDHHFDDMLDDIALALETVKSKSEEWGVRDRGFVLVGVSSGAHLSLLYSYGVQRPGEVKAAVSVAGPTDLATLSSNPTDIERIAEQLVGAPASEINTHPRFKQASPLYQADKAVPTLMIHGTADDVVAISQSEALKEALDDNSIANKLVPLTGVGHDVNVQPATVFLILDEIRSWVDTHGR